MATLPETNIAPSHKWGDITNGLSMVFNGNNGIFHAPQNGWLEEDPFLLGVKSLFAGALAATFRGSGGKLARSWRWLCWDPHDLLEERK